MEIAPRFHPGLLACSRSTCRLSPPFSENGLRAKLRRPDLCLCASKTSFFFSRYTALRLLSQPQCSSELGQEGREALPLPSWQAAKEDELLQECSSSLLGKLISRVQCLLTLLSYGSALRSSRAPITPPQPTSKVAVVVERQLGVSYSSIPNLFRMVRLSRSRYRIYWQRPLRFPVASGGSRWRDSQRYYFPALP